MPADRKSIKEWAESDRPREKLLKNGAENLSDAELLAIIIGSGTRTISAVELSRRILSAVDNDMMVLGAKSVEELMEHKGIGLAKAISIKAVLELIKRKKYIQRKRRKISSSKDVYEEMYPELYNKVQEEFWVVFLNRNNIVVNKKRISIGGISNTIADPKVIFKYALLNNASAIIIVHNHPSGNIEPSDADISLTKKIKKGAEVLDINFLDHVIFSDSDYYSFVDNNKL